MILDGIPVLVVADPYSRMRNQLRFIIGGMAKEKAQRWLDDWNFIPSPYDEIETILHEAFHVHQKKMAPEKFADESVVTTYPLLDPTNNALHALEGLLLKDALVAEEPASRRQALKQFIAVRAYRQSRLDRKSVRYENLNEYVEGTAKYVEYKFLRVGEKIQPMRDMSLRNGFHGFAGVLSKRLRDRIEDMVRIAGVTDDRLMGNRFGAGPLRFRLYELGACQALLLDEVLPSWKERVFKDGVYLCGLLQTAVPMSTEEQQSELSMAQKKYGFDALLQAKVQFEQDGKKAAQDKADQILRTKQTHIAIDYHDLVGDLRMSYTPFGVTQVTRTLAVYDMVPIHIRFKAGVDLRMKQVIPVLVNRADKTVHFAVATPREKLAIRDSRSIDCNEFSLSGPCLDVSRDGNGLRIRIRSEARPRPLLGNEVAPPTPQAS